MKTMITQASRVCRDFANIIGLCALWLLAAPAHGEACKTQAAEVAEIAAGVYVREGQHGPPFVTTNFANIGFIIGRDCVAVIDSGGSLEEGQALQCAVAAVTDVPVCYLIISHHHFDHALGSLAFTTPSDSVQLIGHDKLAQALTLSADYYQQQLTAAGTTFTKNMVVLPEHTIAVGEELALDLGGRQLRIRAYPPAHSASDLSILDQQTGTLWLSDLLFVDHIPTLDGSILGWLAVLNELLQRPAVRAVPGHGPRSVVWPQGAADLERYLTTLRYQTRRLLQQEGQLREAQETVGRSEQNRWQFFDLHHGRNVSKVFTELEWE